MRRKRFVFWLALIFLVNFLSASSIFAQEQITLTTYYPAPFGGYDRMRLVPHDSSTSPITCDSNSEGTMYYDDNDKAIKVCKDDGWGNIAWTNAGGIWERDATNGYIYPAVIDDAVGIGNSTPQEILHVSGNIQISPTGTTSGHNILGVRGEWLHFSSYGGTHIILNADNAFSSGETDDFSLYAVNDATTPLLRVQGADSNVGNVGIGVAAPVNKLDINGAAAIGSSYAGTNTAPANGLIVEGFMGIGTASPARALHVAGAMRIGSASQPSSPVAGDLYNNGTDLYYYDGTAWRDLVTGLWKKSGSDIYYDDGNVGVGAVPQKLFYVQNGSDPTIKFFFDGSKGALRGGNVSGTQWDDANIGLQSIALGKDVVASGIASFAVGRDSSATNTASIAIGDSATASALASVAFGKDVTSSGTASIAMGYQLSTSAIGSIALGYNVNVGSSGNGSVAIGLDGGGATLNQAKTLAIMGGRVGIGTVTPTFYLELPNSAATGTARAFAWTTYSDGRFKVERTPLKNALDLVAKLKPIKYKMLKITKDDHGFIHATKKVQKGTHIGLVAQDVYKVIPEAVLKPKDENKEAWGISYDSLVPVLIQAVKELKQENEKLKERIEALERKK